MPLHEEYVKSGQWLFRWRSYMPLLVFVLLLLALPDIRLPSYGPKLALGWQLICLVVSCLGILVRAITVGFAAWGTSGRNTRNQVARSLNTTGAYSLVRNPLYFGNFLIFLGLTMFIALWWFTLICVMAFWLYYEKIIFAEESFLREKFGDDYVNWAQATPVFVPRVRGWVRPELPFSIKTVIRREYPTVLATVFTFVLLDYAVIVGVERTLRVDAVWLSLLGASLLMYLIVRVLVKTTRILNP